MDKAILDFNPFDQTTIDRLTGETGWEYKDFEKMPEKNWDDLLAIFGDGNYKIVPPMQAVASYKRTDGQIFKRAQLFISPQGLANAKAHVASKGN